MKSRKKIEKSAVELVEEAVHSLRLAPLYVPLSYLIGTLPFVLGFLYFWSDMGRSAFAADRCLESSLLVALLFVWMKFWQSIFATALRDWIGGNPAPDWKLRAVLRTLPAQTLIHATGWIVLPIAALVLLPFAWTFSFYQNVLVVSASRPAGLMAISRSAINEAKLWPRQNHVALITLKVCALFVFLNVTSAIVLVPFLLKTLFGTETSFTQSASALLNSTFFISAFALTWLCVDPLIKAVYALRCFYGESVSTGEDLRTELGLIGKPRTAKAVAVLLACVSIAAPASGQQNAAPLHPEAVNAIELDRAIREVLQSSEFSWRVPRETFDEEAGPGWLGQKLQAWMRAVRESVRSFLDWLDNRGRFRSAPSSGGSGFDWVSTLRGLVVVLCIALAALLAALVLRAWRKRQRTAVQVEAVPLAPVPDLEKEDVAASDLPEDDWLRLAGELFEKGETRLALRALYLSTLAHLARRHLITVTRSKSNLEYERELRRRAHALPDALDAFSENVAIIDRVWYGMYFATEELVQRFRANQKLIQQP